MRCGKCGNENAEGNRFCGMCGTALVGKPAGVVTSSAQVWPTTPVGSVTGASLPTGSRPGAIPAQSVAARNVARAPEAGSPELGMRAEPRPVPYSAADDEPVITGPSFLGLNQPANRAGRTDSYGRRNEPQSPAGNLDYLLDDEEEPKRSWGKIILVVVALALALGFGYLHWKQGGFEWLNAGEKKPAAQTSPDGTQSGTDSGSATTNSGAANPSAASGGAVPQGGVSGSNTAPAAGSAASPPESSAPQAAPIQNTSPGASSESAPAAPSSSPSASIQNTAPQTKPNALGAAASQAADSDSETETAPAELPAAAKPRPSKPAAAKPTPAKPFDTVAEAERYIYGRGVRQDCDLGLRLLKPAAQSNPAAMISLGKLYSTGTCTPRDLPTAYRWFAVALHKQPDNQPLQDDLQKLWSQMTQPERQLAIKLSQ